MKDNTQYTVIWNEDLSEVKSQIKGGPLDLDLVFYDTFGTYNNRTDAIERMRVINRIYKRDEGITMATNILEH